MNNKIKFMGREYFNVKTMESLETKITQLQQELDKYKLVASGEIRQPDSDMKFYLIDNESENLVDDLFKWLLEEYDGKPIAFYIKQIGKE